MQRHQLATQRFANTVILPLANLFRVCSPWAMPALCKLIAVLMRLHSQLEPSSISIFHDSAGPLIAFNRGGTLYLNL
jgi:hypothetical protein